MKKKQAKEESLGKNRENKNDFLVVGIGVSAGGIKSLQAFFSQMPPNQNMAFVVIIHLPENKKSQLAPILQSQTKMEVLQVQQTTKVIPNKVYIIPPGKQLEIKQEMIRLVELKRSEFLNLAIDHFFSTLGKAYQERSVGVILSGSGRDGTEGLLEIKKSGGFSIVQDMNEATYSSMPKSAVDAGLVDFILPVSEIVAKLIELERKRPKLKVLDALKGTEGDIQVTGIQDILALVKVRTGNDFSFYKQPTLKRRISRQMQVHDFDHIGEYHAFLRENPDEVEDLLANLLINVTEFFRDKEAFEALEQEVISLLLKNKNNNDNIRVWVPACATGEEAYSIAILFYEQMEKMHFPPGIQIFASDLSKASISQAREGYYSKIATLGLSEERLKRFFTQEDQQYRIREEIREMILFTEHNILGDPPFLRLDLISCRNFLIYLSQNAQEKALRLFHFALKPGKYLFLGTSESIDRNGRLFSTVIKRHGIFLRNVTTHTSYQPLDLPSFASWQKKAVLPPNITSEKVFPTAEIHFRLLEEYAPPSILVNSNYEILHLSEHAGQYLEISGGEPSQNLLSLLIPPLRPELRGLLFTAQEGSMKQVEAPGLQIELDGEEIVVDLIVRSVNSIPSIQGVLLVLIKEIPAKIDQPLEVLGQGKKSDMAIREVVERLERELANTKHQLRVTIERYETSLEELQASNEELHAVNEEMSSTTEELETSQEELQSVNEELETVNLELKEKVMEVGRINSNLQNLMNSTNIVAIFLNRELKIQLFTPVTKTIFNVIDTDINRPIGHITNKLEYPELIDDAQKVLESLQPNSREIKSTDNFWYIARILPYRTIDDKIDGVVLTFLDITDRKRAEEQLDEERLRLAVEAANIGIWMYDVKRKKLKWSDTLCKMHGLYPMDFTGQVDQWLEFVHPEDQEEFGYFFTTAIHKADEFTREIRVELPEKGLKWLYLKSSATRNDNGKATVVRGAVFDITERIKAEEQIRKSDQRKTEFLAWLSHELRKPLSPIFAALEILEQSGQETEKNKARAIISRQIKHIERLVIDLLDISRIQLGKIQLQKKPVLLKEIIEAGVEIVQPLIKKKDCELHIEGLDDPVYLEADPVRMAQVIQNILSNAVKFNDKGGGIYLQVIRKGSDAIISIKDNGDGIESEDIKSIFDLFYQGNQTEHTNNISLGVGLNLSRQLVELHGGHIEVSSKGKYQGSEFIITVPYLKDYSYPADKEKEQKKPELPIQPKRVLLVDDNEDILEALSILLKIVGHKTQLSTSGKDAIKAAFSWKPDAIVLDIGLPLMNGYDVAKKIRKKLPDTLLIAYSGWGQEKDREQSLEAGFDHHVIKPDGNHEIIRLINESQ